MRAALTGLLEFSACAEEVSTDVRTAVSEACNNVVMHAYPGRHGPMRVVAISGPDLFEVQVRDEGAGIHQISRDRLTGGAEHMGLGLALISALCDHVQVRNPAAGGTEVTMRFRTGEHEADDGFSPAQSWADGPEQPPGDDILLWCRPAAMLGHLVGRVARATAAGLGFTIAGASDLYAINDALVGLTDVTSAGGLTVGVSVSDRRMMLTVGPVADAALGARAGGLAGLVDAISTTRHAQGEFVRVTLADHGRQPVA